MVDLSTAVSKVPESYVWSRADWKDHGEKWVADAVNEIAPRVPSQSRSVLVWDYSERDGPMHCVPFTRLADAVLECYIRSAMFRDVVGIVMTDDDMQEIAVWREASQHSLFAIPQQPPSDSIFCCA